MLSVEVVGLAELHAKVDKLEEALNPVAILDEIEALLLNRIRSRFLAETDPDGKKWIPSKRALKDGGKTLFKTGTLFHSIQAHTDGPNERSISTDVPYARPHNFGLGHMPIREFMGFNEEDLDLIVGLVLQRLREALS